MATYPAAVRWDLATQDYALDATTGEHIAEHPVDAAVTIRLGFRQGTIAGDPTTGHTLHLVDMSQPTEQRQRDIEERQAASLGSLITDGLVEILSVGHQFENGRLEVLTTYRNLATGEPGTVTSG